MRRTFVVAVASLVLVITGCDDGAGTAGSGGSAGSTTSIGAGGDASATTGMGGAAVGTGSVGSGGSGGAAGVGGAGVGGAATYGALTGACGDIDLRDVESTAPQVVLNTLDFTGEPAFDPMCLSPGGQEVISDGNLGGSSLNSEAIAYEILYRCDQAVLLKTEAEIVYATQGKKTDELVTIDGAKVGVSVVRAMSFPEGDPYPVSQAYNVLEGKLSDILQSSVNVAPQDAWQKQILSVLAQTQAHADAIVQAYATIDPTTKADTIVVITVTEGDDAFIYYGN